MSAKIPKLLGLTQQVICKFFVSLLDIKIAGLTPLKSLWLAPEQAFSQLEN
ncbi:hypothetical protein [Corynebacterium callunae]|nr:hypothetical protein [Corynebacterium callunae]